MATELCKQLLERGWHVRATVRNKADEAKTGHLLRLAQVTPCSNVNSNWVGSGWLESSGPVQHYNEYRHQAMLLLQALPGHLELYTADLLRPGSFLSAVKGSHVVFHTA